MPPQAGNTQKTSLIDFPVLIRKRRVTRKCLTRNNELSFGCRHKDCRCIVWNKSPMSSISARCWKHIYSSVCRSPQWEDFRCLCGVGPGDETLTLNAVARWMGFRYGDTIAQALKCYNVWTVKQSICSNHQTINCSNSQTPKQSNAQTIKHPNAQTVMEMKRLCSTKKKHRSLNHALLDAQIPIYL